MSHPAATMTSMTISDASSITVAADADTGNPEALDRSAAALQWRGELRRDPAARSGKRLAGWTARDDREPTVQLADVLAGIAAAEPATVDVTTRDEALADPSCRVPGTWLGRVSMTWPDGRNGVLDCWASTVADMVEEDRFGVERREYNRQVRAYNKRMREAVRKGGFVAWAAQRGL